MADYIPVKDNSNLLRDPKTNAILNVNKSEYDSYMSMKTHKENQNSKIDEMESELNNIRNDINEIKNLLREFIK